MDAETHRAAVNQSERRRSLVTYGLTRHRSRAHAEEHLDDRLLPRAGNLCGPREGVGLQPGGRKEGGRSVADHATRLERGEDYLRQWRVRLVQRCRPQASPFFTYTSAPMGAPFASISWCWWRRYMEVASLT